MNRPELYNKTVDILYQAYFNDTLQHGNCYACAVGNLVTANLGYKYVRCVDSESKKIAWEHRNGKYYWSKAPTWFNAIKDRSRSKQALQEVSSTGYNIAELKLIEDAFESANKSNSSEDYMFNGLVAVLDVLRQIHEVADEDLLATNSKRFSDHYKTKCHATL